MSSTRKPALTLRNTSNNNNRNHYGVLSGLPESGASSSGSSSEGSYADTKTPAPKTSDATSSEEPQARVWNRTKTTYSKATASATDASYKGPDVTLCRNMILANLVHHPNPTISDQMYKYTVRNSRRGPIPSIFKNLAGDSEVETESQEENKEETKAAAQDAMKSRVETSAASLLVFPSARPSDRELMALCRKNPDFTNNLHDHFCAAVDLLSRTTLVMYQDLTSDEWRKTGEWTATAPKFRYLTLGLYQELMGVQMELKLPDCYGEPGTWQYLEDQKTIDCLNERAYHRRLFRVFHGFGFEPHHWSAIMFLRSDWCGLAGKEPKRARYYEYDEKKLGMLEFVMKEYMGRAYIAQQMYTDNLRFVQHVLELAGAFKPCIGNEWWK
ncbi:hypothetical protein BJ508DRAFT_331349 [Ascobolus immersus RN42]|uniref:Uncharacterized protein n=1 Tax=Ascobolus immersus RN42 TaxID=1160509 RepID=A0A3N4I2T8_ASCIM|nr:hypothetical protein BJ508DRAFT_331349 [Ascobolus immersus RN42]